MQTTVVSLLLSGFGRDAIKFVAGLTVAALFALLGALLLLLSIVESAAGFLVGNHVPAGPALWATGAAGALVSRGTLAPPLAPAPDSVGAAAVEAARTQLGRPYVWGGATLASGFDCSGLIQWAYAQTGVRLPRTAQQQFDATVRLRPDQVRPGDLVFFHTYDDPRDWVTHVGIYVGNGRMLNAPTQGDVIREFSLDDPYWRAHYAGAGRILIAGVPGDGGATTTSDGVAGPTRPARGS